MNFFKRIFGGSDVVLPAQQQSVTANPDWHTYRAGEGDRAGRKIKNIYAVDDDYVVYFIDCEMYYETTAPRSGLGSADAALARINRLLTANPAEGSREYKINVSTLELAADAFEMFFSGEKTEALEILNGIREKLQANQESQRRLMYQAGAVIVTALAWVLYLLFQHTGWVPEKWEPWVMTAALAMAGGLFSVCLTIGSLEVNVNQKHLFLFLAGTTRSVVAFLAGIGLLLAMRSKMFAGIVYSGDLPGPGDALKIAEMFFCFLAGFSESFVPNILRDSEKKPGAEKPPAAAPKEVRPDDKPTASDNAPKSDQPDNQPADTK